MTWDAFHRRGEVLRNVLEHAETHRDGALPMELPGVAETFGDELTLLGALQLRWHTRLAGAIERELMGQPVDLESAVTTAWRKNATELAGLRAILDACTESPASEEMAAMLEKAHGKDWTLMAAMAGKASPADHAAARVGRAIEEKAREAYRPGAARQGEPGRRRAVSARQSLLERVKAHLHLAA
jgi:hypothetical protein